jgi:hypothetical protein
MISLWLVEFIQFTAHNTTLVKGRKNHELGAELDHEADRTSEIVEISVMDVNQRLSVE